MFRLWRHCLRLASICQRVTPNSLLEDVPAPGAFGFCGGLRLIRVWIVGMVAVLLWSQWTLVATPGWRQAHMMLWRTIPSIRSSGGEGWLSKAGGLPVISHGARP